MIQFSYFIPTISTISPGTTYNSTLLTITGTQFGQTSSPVVVTLNNVVDYICNSPTWVSSTSITCSTPYNLPSGPYLVKVSVGSQESALYNGQMHLLTPIISLISPGTGPALGNTAISITVSNSFSFVGVNFTFYVNSSYSINRLASCPNFTPGIAIISCLTPVVPFSAAYNVTVTVGSLTGQPYVFPYAQASINSITNTGSTVGGYMISINGVNFGTGVGQVSPPQVTFGSASCTDASRVSDDLITCIAPAVFCF